MFRIAKRILPSVCLLAVLAVAPPASAQVFYSATLSKKAAPLSAADALMKKALDAEHAGDIDGAMQTYHQVLAMEPDADGAYLNLANAYRQKRDYGIALADYNKAIELNGDVPLYWNMRGILYRETDKCDLAIADFNKSLSLADTSDQGVSHAGLGLCLLDQKDYPAAVKQFDAAIGSTHEPADPNLTVYFSNRGLVKAMMGAFPGAIADLSEAMSHGPHDAVYARTLTLRGMAHRMNGQPDAAQADITEAINIESSPERFYERGLARQMKGNFDGARMDFGEAIREDHKSADAASWLQARGDIYVREHQPMLALDDYDAAAKLAPPDAQLLNARCWARIDAQKNPDAGMADCQAALKLEPDNPELLDSMGRIWFAKHDYAQAIAQYDAALKGMPPQSLVGAQILYHRGMAKKAEGDKKGSAADIAHALKIDPYAGSPSNSVLAQ